MTPSKYPSSVDVTADTATFPTPVVTSALFPVIVSVSIVEADPVISAISPFGPRSPGSPLSPASPLSPLSPLSPGRPLSPTRP